MTDWPGLGVDIPGVGSNLTGDDLEGYPDSSNSSSGPTGSGDVEDFDISGYPFRFNPALHPGARHVRTDLGGENPRSNLEGFYDETGNTYKADFDERTGSKKTNFEKLRLGRLVMTELALARGIVEGGKRYGFRFLYNPTQLSGSMHVNSNFVPERVERSGIEVGVSGHLVRLVQLDASASTLPQSQARGNLPRSKSAPDTRLRAETARIHR